MYKLGRLEGNRWVEHSHPPVYQRAKSADGSERIVAGVPGGDSDIFSRLVTCLEPPYFLLYVLHTPRGEGNAGRYQSTELSSSEFREFVAQFDKFLSRDARFDLWAHSPTEQATVVWDRHDQLFAYGPVEKYEVELQRLGFSKGLPQVPTPHEHHYHAELDSMAKQLLLGQKWSYSALRPEDEQ